jgi:hypothetical protein
LPARKRLDGRAVHVTSYASQLYFRETPQHLKGIGMGCAEPYRNCASSAHGIAGIPGISACQFTPGAPKSQRHVSVAPFFISSIRD